MKLNVVKHRAGKVIANCEKAQGDRPSVTELDYSHTVHEIAVAGKCADRGVRRRIRRS
jgi:hypothetical protein